MEYVIAIILVILSGLFSGLTLGLLSLDTQSLQRRAKYGDKNAEKIYPIRENGNLLLTTLLLGNVAVNTTLSLFLGTIASGVIAGLMATTLIVLFGEIVPQAVISRHALWFGARTIWFTRTVIFLLYPIAFPISKILDLTLGSEIPKFYSKTELMDLFTEHHHSENSQIDADEKRIVHGALQFSHTRVKEVMTKYEDVISFDENVKLNDEFFEEVGKQGFSRLPIYSGDKSNIVGMLYAKDLLTEDENISIKHTENAFNKHFITVRPNDLLDKVLASMLKQRQHLAIVKTKSQQFMGIISLEDIIEEIIQHEIKDEDDDEE